ncbi:hypothetical protein DM860_004134 [Cuscuta australis]|uniref:Uncharacterized protein n=1 Tax=Cuscuta australis TaxID=267555 RepID=A0A328CVA3_9ASTE|nr:hypothetical protein DM860_004134 [Cuscuta australis]
MSLSLAGKGRATSQKEIPESHISLLYALISLIDTYFKEISFDEAQSYVNTRHGEVRATMAATTRSFEIAPPRYRWVLTHNKLSNLDGIIIASSELQ